MLHMVEVVLAVRCHYRLSPEAACLSLNVTGRVRGSGAATGKPQAVSVQELVREEQARHEAAALPDGPACRSSISVPMDETIYNIKLPAGRVTSARTGK